jgi:hypothetical protein
MKHKIFIFIFSLILTVSLGSLERVLACGSGSYMPTVCEMYGKSKAVFVGKVLQVTEIKKENTSSDFKIDFQVQEKFFGVEKQSRVSVLLFGAKPEYCGFEKDKSFLVYAYKGSSGFSIDAGTRTKPLNEAEEDLEFLRNLPRNKSGVNIYGTITKAVKSSLEENSKSPVSALKLKFESLTGKPQIFYAVTNEDGNYEINGIPGGKYKISPSEPLAGYFFKPEVGFGEVEINDKGCVAYNFTLTTNNKFVGKIIDFEGNPVNHITVEILSANAPRPNSFIGEEYSNTNPDGTFYAYNITPGLYTVSINYSFLPNEESPYPTYFYPGVGKRSQAAVIEIKPGTDITNFEFRLPPRLEKKIIKGKIVWANGTPAVGVTVHLFDSEYESCCINTGVKTNERGEFSQIGYQGRIYRIWANGNKTDSIETGVYGVSPEFPADGVEGQTIILNMNYVEFEKELDGGDNLKQ